MASIKKTVRGTRPGATHRTGPGGLGAADFARWYRDRSREQWDSLDLHAIERIAAIIERARDAGRFVWTCGNGGSAATAAHVGCDFGRTARVAGAKPLRCASLADHGAMMTAIANDSSFAETFSAQLETVASKGDVVLLISGSGNSENLLRAARAARGLGAIVIGLLGFDGGRLSALCDEVLLIPSDQYGVIEDMHMSIAHILTFYLKQKKA